MIEDTGEEGIKDGVRGLRTHGAWMESSGKGVERREREGWVWILIPWKE